MPRVGRVHLRPSFHSETVLDGNDASDALEQELFATRGHVGRMTRHDAERAAVFREVPMARAGDRR